MLGPIHEYPVVIREHHLDTFGHVNNAAYLDILEEARWTPSPATGTASTRCTG